MRELRAASCELRVGEVLAFYSQLETRNSQLPHSAEWRNRQTLWT